MIRTRHYMSKTKKSFNRLRKLRNRFYRRGRKR